MNKAIKEDEFELKVGTDAETGRQRWLTIRKSGKLHSPSDEQPAWIVFDEQGRATMLAWFHENFYHRTTGPALVRCDPETETVIYEEYRLFGKMHRADGNPALIERDPKTGEIVVAMHFLDDIQVVPNSGKTPDPSP